MSTKSQAATLQKQLNAFGKILDDFKPWLEERYGIRAAGRLVTETMKEYQAILPHLPALDRDPQVRLFFEPTPRYLAVYRAMTSLGYSTEETGRVVYAMGGAAIEALPRPLRRLLGWLWFNTLFKRLMSRRATITQSSPHPQGFVIEFLDGRGQDFDFGVDYLECATLKYLASNDALPLTPYICAIDRLASEKLGWGLRRETTLAAGDRRCEFRFTRGGPTRVPIPPALEALAPVDFT